MQIPDLFKDCQRLCNILGSKGKMLMKEQLFKGFSYHQNLLAKSISAGRMYFVSLPQQIMKEAR